MNDALLSVLLLAWDDADPAPSNFGAPLPTGSPLRTALAAQVRLTAILPQQPAAEETAAISAPSLAAVSELVVESPIELPVPADAQQSADVVLDESSEALITSSIASSPDTQPAEQDIEEHQTTPEALLPAATLAAAFVIPEPGAPVIIGLANFTLAELTAEASRWGSMATNRRPEPAGWLMPAAPYIGSSQTPDTQHPATGFTEAATFTEAAIFTETATPGAATAKFAAPSGSNISKIGKHTAPTQPVDLRGDWDFDPDPELPALVPLTMADDFAEAVELGAAEAADLTQWADDLTLAPEVTTPVPAARSAALASLRLPAAPPTAAPTFHNTPAAVTTTALAASAPVTKRLPAPELVANTSLPFRIIQYARFAAQLTAGGAGFDLIFSAAWPTWLAAVEIRQLTGRPLILFVAELPSAQVPLQARGWLLELERRALRRADLVLVPTAALAHHLTKAYQLAQAPQVLAEPPQLTDSTTLTIDSTLFVAALVPRLRAATTGLA